MSVAAKASKKFKNEQTVILSVLEHWKTKCFDLEKQLNFLQVNPMECITVKAGGKTSHIRLSDIIMFEAESNYTYIHTMNGHRYLTSKTLKYWNEKMGINPDFIRTHRTFLVNKWHILLFSTSSKKITVTGYRELPLTRSLKVDNE